MRRVCLALTFAVVAPAANADIQVTTDSGSRNVAGACALRDAMVAIRTRMPFGGCPAGQSTDTIVLPAGAVITLSEVDPDAYQIAGLPDVPAQNSVTILGNGSTIQRNNAVPCDRDGVLEAGELRLFEASGSLKLYDLTLRGGCADGSASGGAIAHRGAPLTGTTTFVLDRVKLIGNRAHSHGGALAISGVRTQIDYTTFESNVAAIGGAIFNNSGPVFVDRSLFRLNQIVDTAGFTTLGNYPAGAAIANVGSFRLTNSTVAGNLDFSTEQTGGAIAMLKPITGGDDSLIQIRFSTIASNFGYGLSVPHNHFGDLLLENSIVAYNTAADCLFQSGDQRYGGLNLISDFSHCYRLGDPALRNDVDPLLGALADNGGPTLTMAIGAASPAYNAAPGCTDGLFPISNDQRGQIRRYNTESCDIGAFELQDAIHRDGFE